MIICRDNDTSCGKETSDNYSMLLVKDESRHSHIGGAYVPSKDTKGSTTIIQRVDSRRRDVTVIFLFQMQDISRSWY